MLKVGRLLAGHGGRRLSHLELPCPSLFEAEGNPLPRQLPETHAFDAARC